MKEYFFQSKINADIPKSVGTLIQGDTGNIFVIAFIDGYNRPLDLSDITTIQLKVLKPDGKEYIDSIGENIKIKDAKNGVIEVGLKDQAVTTPGINLAHIEIYSGAKRITTSRFNYEVKTDLMNPNLSSQSDYPTLLSLMTQLSSQEETRKQSETGRINAENTRVSQENSRKQAETGRINAESARVSAENTRSSQEESRKQAETGRVNAENQRNNAEAGRVGAENARVTSETNRNQAEETRDTAENRREQATTNAINQINAVKETVENKLNNGEFIGAQGPQGVKGDKGDKGDTGIQGPQGIQGSQGIKGDKGDKGDVGPQGIQGPKGDTGNTGAQGPQGIQGPQGDKGDIGTSNVTLNGENQQNFNFIANEVVSDGLVCKTNGFERFIVGSKAKVANITNQNKVTMMASFSYKGELSAYRKIFHITSTTEGNSAFFIDITGNDSKSYRIRLGENVVFVPTDSVYNKTDLCIALDNENGIAIISINGNVYSYNYIPRETAKIAIGGIVVYSGGQEFIGDLNSCVYNRILTPTEISHNFNVLNNSPSISHLETTDSTGSTTKQLFYADSSHVEMDTGRTVQQELDAYRSIMSKEFTSTGEEIRVDNAIESKVIGLSMEGQTVKCIYDEKVVTVIGNGSSWGSSPKILSSIPQLLPNKEYTIFCEVIENTLVHNYNINSPSNIRAFLLNGTKIPPKATGLFASKHMTANSFVGIDYSLYSAFDSNTETGTIKFKRFVVEGDFTDKISSYIPFGLSSTQAQLTVNGHTTKFYEPTISGQTKIVNATGEEVEAGTEGARLVSLEPSGEASLIEGLPSLGSVPSISDTIDRGTREMIINSSDYILINDTSWKIAPWSNTTNTLAFEHPLENCPSKDLKDICICNNFNTKSGQDVFQNDVEAIGVGWNNVVVRVNRSKLTTQDVNGFKAWLQANPTTVRYQLATPQVIQLTPDQVKAYDAHKKQILLSKVGDVTDSFEVREDGSGVWNRSISNKIAITGNPANDITLLSNGLGILIGCTKGVLGYPQNELNSIAINSDTFKGVSWNETSKNNSIYLHPNGAIYINFDGSVKTLQECLDFLNTNPITVIGRIPSPTTTHIPKHITPTIPVGNKINILSFGDAVKPSKASVTMPVDRIGEIQSQLQALQNVMIQNTLK